MSITEEIIRIACQWNVVDEYLCVARGSWNVLRIRRMTASDWRAPRTVTKKRTSAPRRTPCVARGQEATTL